MVITITTEAGRAAPRTPRVSVRHVTKKFGSFTALEDVSLDVRAGEVHAVIGANGSGKSTLIKIMSGVHKPTSGSVVFDGDERHPVTGPSHAHQLGARVVHQEAPLIDSLTVLEAIAVFMGYPTAGPLGKINWRALRSRVQRLLSTLDINVPLDALCGKIGPTERASIGLAIAIGDSGNDQVRASRTLILDEVTASIPAADTAAHLETIRRLADAGAAVVMVTHRLAELDIADDVTVLRAGRISYHQAEGPRLPTTDLVRNMVAESHDPLTSRVHTDGGDHHFIERLWTVAPSESRKARAVADVPALELHNIVGRDLAGLSLSAKAGEVVGLVGLPGGGLSELAKILAGAEAYTSGSIDVGGREIRRRPSPRAFIEAGMTTIPADRLRDGGIASLSVQENLTITNRRAYWHHPRRREALVDTVVSGLDVRPSTGRALFGSLSGGNQQKVLLGKWLALQPTALVLDDPTYGVDPAARERIFQTIVDSAALGVCVLFLTTEPELLLRTCTRVVHVRVGKVAADKASADLTPEELMDWSCT